MIQTTIPGKKLRGRAAKSAAIAIPLAATLFFASGGAPAYADMYWDAELKAQAEVKAGNTAGAVPSWKLLLEHDAETGNWTNAALYAKRLGEYFDSIGDYETAIPYYERENEYWLKAGENWGASDLQRAEQIRTTVDLYVENEDPAAAARLAAPAKGGLAKFEPAYGTYIGLYSEKDPQMGNVFTQAESVYGKKHAMFLAYSNWGQPFPARHAQNAKAAGGALQIGWQPMGGLDEVVDGPYLRQWARDAKAAGIPIFLRYACEMNGAWVPWHGDPQKYIEKFRLIYNVMREEAPNVALVWSPGDVPRYTMDAYYPGDDYVDWVGVSLYTEPYGNGDPNDPMVAGSPIERLDELYSLYASRKPLMLSETGVSHAVHTDGSNFQAYGLLNLERLYEIMPKKYPRLKAITYFNVDQGKTESHNDYSLRGDPAILAAYKRLIAAPTFLSKVEQGAKPAVPLAYERNDGAAAFVRETRIVPFVKIPDIYIGKLEYVLNDVVVKTETSPPYALSLKAGDVPEGSTLQLRVYNREGRQVAARTRTLSSEIAVAIDGEIYRFEQPPVIRDERTLAPVRAIFETLGATVGYDDATRTVTGRKGGTTVVMRIGDKTMTVNGVATDMDVPAQLIDGRTMVPARYVGMAFGGTVTWDDDLRTVNIATR
ncbi:stalk domain-containing protein [Paenibacillus cymbidii]|uniref:stalk domain-containing protein n=1 Tax=Paenibacillus cymbidii TaxID=1639034 RepID=UPI00108063B6|nr:stalk domain-containing protein [Paenibacillus cymbidii]